MSNYDTKELLRKCGFGRRKCEERFKMLDMAIDEQDEAIIVKKEEKEKNKDVQEVDDTYEDDAYLKPIKKARRYKKEVK